MKPNIFLLSISGLLCAMPSAFAAIIASDNFSDGDRATSAAWYYGTGTAAPVVNTNGTQQNLYLNATGVNNAQVWTTFTSTTLTVGQSLRVTMNFDVSGGTGNSGDAPLRVGLYNVGTPVNADQDSTTGGIANANWNAATGYGAFVGAVNSGSLAASTTNFRERTGLSNTLWAGGAHTGLSTTPTGTTPVVLGSNADLTTTPLRYSLEYILTRSGADSMNLFLAISDGSGSLQTLSASDVSGIASTFNTLSFFTGGIAAQDYAIDNVVIEVIPEPSAVLVAALAPILLGLRRRR